MGTKKQSNNSKTPTPKSAKKTSTNPSNPNKKKNLKTWIIYGLFATVILALAVALILVLVLRNSSEVCDTPECVTLAHQLLNYQDKSVDPCTDFFKYSCGKYHEHVAVQGSQITKKQHILLALIEEFLVKDKPTSSKTENAMKTLYGKCKELGHKDILGKNYEEIKQDIIRFGQFPIMDGSWKEDNFHLNQMLVNIVSMSRETIDFGIFHMGAAAPHKMFITKADLKEIPTEEEVTERIKKYWRLDDKTNLNSKQVEDVQGIVSLMKELSKMTFTNPISAYPPVPYSNIRFRTAIEFSWVLRDGSGQSKSTLDWDQIEKNLYFYEGFDQIAKQLQGPIKNKKRALANYLSYVYMTNSHYNLNVAKANCAHLVMQELPLPSVRVFVRNHFDKEVIEDVEELVEEVRSSFIEMIKDSEWIDESTKNNAIKKAEKMKKTVAYPKEFETPGALDKIFDAEIDPNDLIHVMMKKIEKFSMKIAFEYAMLGKHMNPVVSLVPNAYYSRHENALNVLPAMIDDPLFHKSYPKFAKIAGTGYIIGHEIGHGFDSEGCQYDENGNYKIWISNNNIKKGLERAKCLINQYNNYDDPTFGKKLKGTTTIDENVADTAGADVAWRLFKKLDLSKEKKIVGFEDYSTEKLFFQISAMNWCAPRETKTLEQQLKDSHATESFRVNGILSNTKQFSEAFDCPAGSPMNPVKKCQWF